MFTPFSVFIFPCKMVQTEDFGVVCHVRSPHRGFAHDDRLGNRQNKIALARSRENPPPESRSNPHRSGSAVKRFGRFERERVPVHALVF